MTKIIKLEQESDLTIWKEYNRFNTVIASWQELLFYTFMIVLYYSGYARWFFWVFLSMWIIITIAFMTDKIPSYSSIIRKELKRRGYKK